MKTILFGYAAVLGGLVCAYSAGAAVRYVNINSTNATPPYMNWATAASNIQDAVDAASAGDEIVVTNGVYETGGRVVYGTLTNRLAVNKPVTVRSVNGPEVTVIRGYQVPDTIHGESAVRCVYLTNDAVLAGFTVTNGSTSLWGDDAGGARGGGVYAVSPSAVISNCVLTGNSAYGAGGGVWRGSLDNCTLIGNSSFSGGAAYFSTLKNCVITNNLSHYYGGGADRCTLNDCTLTGNSAVVGGGAYECMLTNCTLSGNSVAYPGGGLGLPPCIGPCGAGGGAYGGSLDNCVLTGNSASYTGGGASSGILKNCRLEGNTATGGLFINGEGGGAASATLENCILTLNSADSAGGAASDSRLQNCTVTGNSANNGGGVSWSALTNCIVYSNTSIYGPENGPNFLHAWFNYSCTSPMPGEGFGNITNAPLFFDEAAGDFRLQSTSPCINAGRNAFASAGFDLDGNPRIVGGTVDIGAYEYQSPQSALSYAWLRQHGLPTDGSADLADPDGDGLNTWQEWRASTDPTNSASALRLLRTTVATNGVMVPWQSVSGQTYCLERSSNLTQESFEPIATNIIGQSGATTYADTNAPPTHSFFYRVRVEE